MEATRRRNELYALLGDLPERPRPITSRKMNEWVTDQYRLEELQLNLDGENWVSAHFICPLRKSGPFKTIIFNHSHGGDYELGKSELTKGNVYLQHPSYAETLTEMGYAVLCFDMWGFESRRVKTESELFKEMLWNGQVLWGKMVYDSMRAVDYLNARADVDANHIGTLGMSMGGVMAWWLAALDSRIGVCIDICGMVDFHTLIENKNLDAHGLYFYVPNLLKHFSTAEINGLISPRPHLSLVGITDHLTPEKGLHFINEQMKKIYKNRPEAWEMRMHKGNHVETSEMREEVKAFLRKWL